MTNENKQSQVSNVDHQVDDLESQMNHALSILESEGASNERIEECRQRYLSQIQKEKAEQEEE